MHFIDWLILIVYFLGTAVVGLLYMRRAGKSTKEFFVSGRDLPWWLAGTSMVATSFASDTPLFVTGLIRKEGIWRNWVWWSFAIGGMFAVFFMSRLWRRSEVITDVEFTELRYSGKSAAILRGFRGVYLAFYINCITMAWVILAMLKFFQVAFGISRWEALAISCGITVAYSALSGLWGVVVTDMIQFAIAIFASIILAVRCVEINGGFTGLRDAVIGVKGASSAVLRFFPEFPSVKSLLTKEFWTPAVTSFFVFISIQWWANKNSDGGSVVIQRMLACKSEKDSLLASLWFNIANYSLRTWPWVIVALASIAAFPTLKHLPAGVDDESVYVHMFMTLLPTGLLGLMIASFFAAFMSTISTHINLASAYFVNDIYKRFLVRQAEEKHYVFIARIASVAFMVISALMSLKFKSIKDIFEFLLAFSSGVGIVYILRWFWWRINAWTEVAAMVTSSVVSILLYVVPVKLEWMRTLSSQETLLATVIVSLVISLLVTFLTRPVADRTLVEFYRRVRPPGFWGPIAAQVDLPPEARPRYGRDLVNWIAGVALIFGSMFGLGKLCLGFWTSGVVYCSVSVVGAVVIWWNLSLRESATPATEET